MLEIRDFSKSFGQKRAVDHLTLTVEAGDILGFIGPNGAGKSTTIKAIVGVLDFDEGEILVGGDSIARNPVACKQQLAYLPDNPDLYEHLTGIAYINFVADIFGVSAEERTARTEKYAEAFEVVPILGDPISSYSHGTKQKIALLGAMVHAPRLLVLDEPFVGLDPKAALTLKTIMHNVCAEGGAVFFSTHVLDVAEKLCNKIAIIRDGKLAASGEMQALIQNGSLEDLFMEIANEK